MNPGQQRRVAGSAALGLVVVALLLVLVLGVTGQLGIGAVIGLLIAVAVYGSLVLWRLGRAESRR